MGVAEDASRMPIIGAFWDGEDIPDDALEAAMEEIATECVEDWPEYQRLASRQKRFALLTFLSNDIKTAYKRAGYKGAHPFQLAATPKLRSFFRRAERALTYYAMASREEIEHHLVMILRDPSTKPLDRVQAAREINAMRGNHAERQVSLRLDVLPRIELGQVAEPVDLRRLSDEATASESPDDQTNVYDRAREIAAGDVEELDDFGLLDETGGTDGDSNE